MLKLVKILINIVLALMVMLMFSCEDDKYISSSDATITLSTDTLRFDTIFTTVGSITKSYRVYNNHDLPILISSVSLGGKDDSPYRLNVDGIVGNEIEDVEIPPKDSIFIFVELTVDPNGANQPMIVEDSVVFETNSNFQRVKLLAWGQDFVPISDSVLTTATWTNDKPYLVYNYAYVDSNAVLTIEKGTHIYFHKDAGLYVKGTVLAQGTYEEPIIFQGDRLEEIYKEVPDQWNGILLFSGSKNNIFENVSIKNANIGLQVGTIEHEGGADVDLHNVKIENMAYAGIFALKSEIVGSNVLVANCGYYCMALTVGGSYEFNHATIANFWGGYSTGIRKSASLTMSNILKIDNSNGTITYVNDLQKATFRNSIIYGNNSVEIEVGSTPEVEMNYYFDHCLVKVADSVDVADKEYYNNVIKNLDPVFVAPYEYDYQLDSISVCIDAGNKVVGEMISKDLLNNSRIDDKGPDLGVYERKEKGIEE